MYQAMDSREDEERFASKRAAEDWDTARPMADGRRSESEVNGWAREVRKEGRKEEGEMR
jgi:hypothetical protein